jgi:DNA-binding transcriptional LysR family regulator
VTLDQIHAFLAVVRYGNFASAASSLYLTQSALGHRISNLEKELNIELFMRARGVRRVELTKEGERFIPIAKDMETLWLKALGLSEDNKQRNVRIALIFSLQGVLIPVILNKLREEGYKPYIVSSNTNNAIRSIIAGDLDFAIVGNSIPLDRDAYSVDVLAHEQLVLLTKVDSRYPQHISIKDLNPEYEIYSPWSTSNESWHYRIFGESFVPSLSIEDVSQLGAMIESDPNSWALVPYGVAKSFSSRGKLTICELSERPPEREVLLISRRPIMTECHDILLEAAHKGLAENHALK